MKPVLNLISKLSNPVVFLIIIIPFSVILGYLFPDSSESFQKFGKAGVGLIALPAIPIVLSSVVLATERIARNSKSNSKFTKLLGLGIFLSQLSAILIGLFVSGILKPGILSEQAESTIGQFIDERSAPIHIVIKTIKTTSEKVKSIGDVIYQLVPPNNLSSHLAASQTLKVIVVAVFIGLVMSTLPSERTNSIRMLFKDINIVSKKLLDYILLFAPIITITLIAGAASSPSAVLFTSTIGFAITFIVAVIVLFMLSTGVFHMRTNRLVYREGAEIYDESIGEVESKNKEASANLSRSISIMSRAFTSAMTASSSLATYSMLTRDLKNLGFESEESETALSLNLILARTGGMLYMIVVIVFSWNLFNIDTSISLITKAIALSLLLGVATAGLAGLATIPVLMIGIAELGIPTEPLLLILVALDPLLSYFRAGTGAVTAMAVSTFACENPHESHQEGMTTQTK